MTAIVHGSGVRANPRFGRVRWLLGHVAPDVFGTPYHMVVTLRGPDGKVKQRQRKWNTVTSVGKNQIADQLLASPTIAKPTHMAVGTGSPSATALGTELDRNAFTSKTRSTNVVTCVGDWAAGDGTGAITEAGWFNAASSGDMTVSSTFAVVNKGALDTLNISWALTIA